MKKFEICETYAIVKIITIKGYEYTRTFDAIKNELYWHNEFKQYVYNEKTNNWEYYSKRKGSIETDGSCWLEIEYQKQIRKKKIKNLIDDDY